MKAPRRGSARLRKLIEEATVDANDEYEQEAGFLNELEEHLRCPFRGLVVGEWVDVQRFDVGEGVSPDGPVRFLSLERVRP